MLRHLPKLNAESTGSGREGNAKYIPQRLFAIGEDVTLSVVHRFCACVKL